METPKEFIQLLRKLELTNETILLNVDKPKIERYIPLLNDVKFEEVFYYKYFGDVSKIINSFMLYWDSTVDALIKERDRVLHSDLNCESLVQMVDKTIKFHQIRQEEFGRSFLPVVSQIEKDTYLEVESMYSIFMDKLLNLRATVEKLDKPDKVANFAVDHFQKSLEKQTELLKFTHTFLVLMLADRLYQIKTSLIEILQRVQNNLQAMNEKSDHYINGLLDKIYNKHKEQIAITRHTRKSSVDIADVEKSILNIRIGIEAFKKDVPTEILENEVEYWKIKITEFNAISDVLNKLKAKQEEIVEEEKIYKNMKCTELPGPKLTFWENMGANIRERKENIKTLIIEAAKPLLTFFGVKGYNSIFYTDDIGKYYVDAQGHKVYVFDYGLHVYHLDEDGVFRNYDDTDKHYYDEYGRFTLNENGEKIYQLDTCGSSYKIGDENILIKIPKDSKDTKPDSTIQPKRYDIKATLTKDDVAYLWEGLGHLLPDALHDVAVAQPKDPIHYLAHKILYHKYCKTFAQTKAKKQEAASYTADIYKKRQERAKAESQAWKAKQVKRRKPEESDDAYNIAVYNAHVERELFIQSLQLL